jgi:hypothetical protein
MMTFKGLKCTVLKMMAFKSANIKQVLLATSKARAILSVGNNFLKNE